MNDRDRIAKRDRIHASIEKMRDLKAERRHENAARAAQAMATIAAEDDIDLDALRADIESQKEKAPCGHFIGCECWKCY